MKIIINSTPLLAPLTGVGNYLYQLVNSFELIDSTNTYMYYAAGKTNYKPIIYKENETVGSIYSIKERIKNYPLLGVYFRKGWTLIRRTIESVSTLKGYYDIYFEPNFIPLNFKVKKRIVTVHDLSFLLHPEWHVDEAKFLRKSFLNKLGCIDIIITVSNTVKNEIYNITGFDLNRIKVINNGLNHDLFKKCPIDILSRYKSINNIPQNFILFVGSIEPRKNLLRLLNSYINLPHYVRKEVPLILIGFKGWKNKNVMDIINKKENNILYYGYLPENELAYMYNLATLFIYPSLYEGFGLPPLEAMACGAPVILSDIPVHKEIYNGSAHFCNPLDEDDIASKMLEVIESTVLRNSLSQKGLARARLLDWRKCAEEHLHLFETVLAEG